MLAQSIKAYGGRIRMSLGWDHHRQQIEKVIKDRDILATRWSGLQEKKAQCHNSSPQSSDDLLVSLRRGVGGGGGGATLYDSLLQDRSCRKFMVPFSGFRCIKGVRISLV